jgi:hypothetical protein
MLGEKSFNRFRRDGTIVEPLESFFFVDCGLARDRIVAA